MGQGHDTAVVYLDTEVVPGRRFAFDSELLARLILSPRQMAEEQGPVSVQHCHVTFHQ